MNALVTYALAVLSLALLGLSIVLWHRARTAARDLSRRTESQEALEAQLTLIRSEQVDLLELLRELPQLTAAPEPDRRLRDIPELLHRALLRFFQPREAMVFLRRRPTSDDPERSSQLILAATTPGSFYEPGRLIEIGQGVVGRLAGRSGPAGGDDLEAGADDPPVDLGAPMMHGDEVLGVITLADLGRRRAYDRDLLWLLASLGAYALKSHLELSRVRTVADLDPLTQVYNRAALSLRLAQAILGTESDGGELSVLLFDVDHFKRYNERNGHLAGDELLRQLAGFVAERIRAEDVFGRFGGEKFLLVFPDRAPADAEVAGENIRSAIARHDFLFGDRQPMGRITVSGGIASVPENATGSTELLKAAAAALTAAKQDGRNRVVRSTATPVRDVASVG